ncbi:O-antigen ligase family protein, partial [Testudinibacter aquarius]
EYVMFISTLGYTLFKVADRNIGDVFLTLLVLGFIIGLISNWKVLIQDKILWLFLLSLLSQILSWFHGIYFTPYTPSFFSLSPLANLFYFFILAYWLKGNAYYIFSTLTAYCLGVILACILHSNAPVDEFLLGLTGQRVDFGITNANHTAALAGSSILASIFMIYFFIKEFRIYLRTWYGISYVSFLAIISVINLLLVYMTFSRSIWLALFCVLVILIFYVFFRNVSFNMKFLVKIIVVLISSFLLIYSLLQVPQINSRVFEEHEVIAGLLEKEPDEIASSSVGLRVKFWYSSFDWIKEYPILGLGDRNARAFVIQKSPYLTQAVKDEFQHLHNGYIEILISYGLLGLFVVLGIFFIVFKNVFMMKSMYRNYVIWGAIAFSSYYYVINIFESFFMFKTGEYIQTVFLGCIYSLYLSRTLNNKKDK